MNSALLMLVTGHLKHSVLGVFPVPPIHITDIEGPIVTEPLIIAAVVFVLGVILIPTLFVTRKMRLHTNLRRHLNDYDPSHKDPTFEEEIKKMKLQPQKTITFGQNNIAIDSVKSKLFVRSPKAIDGVLLDYKDIVSYDLIKDDKVIARNGGGGYIDSSAAVDENGIICSNLRLVIKTKKQYDPEVILPFISFSIDSEFAYNEALNAAKEAAQEIEGIIG